MRGELLAACDVDARGLAGDRAFAVYDAEGHIGSGKITRRFRPIPTLRSHTARNVGEHIEVIAADGRQIANDDDALSAALGQMVSLKREGVVPHHDAAAVHLLSTASLAWISGRLGSELDAFAFRPNIVFDTVAVWPAERDWCGSVLAVGSDVRLRITEPAERCIMVNALPDGGRDERVLQIIARESESCLGVYAEVIATGTIREGDDLRLQS